LNTYSTLNVLCSNQNSKSKDPMVQFRFLNIHISHKTQIAMINMPLKWHHTHTHTHTHKWSFEHDLTWFLAYCLTILPNIAKMKKKNYGKNNHIGGKKTCNFSKIWTYIKHNGNNCFKDLIKAFLNSYWIESHLWRWLN